MKLHLGVNDVPYVNHPAHTVAKAKKGGKARPRKGAGVTVTSTGEVALILERRYHLFEIFFEENRDAVGAAIIDSYKGALESVMQGGPLTINPSGAGMAKIETLMKAWISNGGMEKLGYPGVPTAAALAGVNHRKMHPYAKDNPRRPSFRDTGLLQANMRAWMDQS